MASNPQFEWREKGNGWRYTHITSEISLAAVFYNQVVHKWECRVWLPSPNNIFDRSHHQNKELCEIHAIAYINAWFEQLAGAHNV